MCNWVIKCAKLLAGIVAVMKANILASNYARADETTVQVLKAPYCVNAQDFAKLVPTPGYFGSS